MLASVRSKTELVISDTYARVGRRLVSIDYNICVEVMINLPALSALLDTNFCRSTTFSKGTSIPRSPLATIIPSETCINSSTFLIPYRLYNLLIICIYGPYTGSCYISIFLKY